MDSGIKNTFIDFKFEDGDSVKMTLTFYAVYMLKNKNKKIYDEYNKIMAVGVKEEIDLIIILYAAYLCANSDTECMSFEEFIIKCGSNRKRVRETVAILQSPKN